MQYAYGIPGTMVSVHSLADAKLVKDPVPGVAKQLVVRQKELDFQLIYYEYEGLLTCVHCLPFPHRQLQAATHFVFYCHCPEQKSQIHDDNYACFLQHAWPEIKDDPNYFVCILHNVSRTDPSYTQLSSNTIVITRPNIGLDFGAYTDGLHFTGLDDLTQRVLPFTATFLNATVYGPNFPWWLKPKPKWTEVLQSMLTDDVKLAGMTINVWGGIPHVQSMLMITDEVGLDTGMKARVFARRLDKLHIIRVSEAGFSTAVLAAGFNIDCLCQLLHGRDYRVHYSKRAHPLGLMDDVTFDHRYDGHSIHPFETIFSKTNRMNLDLSRKLMEHNP